MVTKEHIDTDSGHLSAEQIAQAVDALKSGEYNRLAQELRNHLKECDACACEVSSTQDIMNNRKAYVLKSSSNTLKPSVPFWKVAASILFIIGAGYTLFYVSSEQKSELVDQTNKQILIPQHKDSIINDDSSSYSLPDASAEQDLNVEKETANTSDLLAFVEDEELEALVASFANGNLRGADIEVSSTSVMELNFGEFPKLEYSNPEMEQLFIEVYDNQGNEILGVALDDRLIYEIKTIETPGLYYWKFMNEDYDLLFCGKIILR